jgi:hypothetical protein
MAIEVPVLRLWCMKRPRPEAIRLYFEDGETKTIPRQGEQSWQEMSESIAALDPVMVEALGKDGVLLRACKSGDLAREDRTRDNRRVEAPPALHADPETARLCFMSDLLHRAYQHSTDVAFERVAGAYDAAFSRLVELVEKVGDRSDAIEKRLERTELEYRREMQDRVDEALDKAAEQAGSGDGLAGLLSQFAGGLTLGQQTAGKKS